MLQVNEQDKRLLIEPLWRSGRGFYLLTLFLLALVAWGGIVWVHQLIEGLSVTGMNRPMYWGVYIVNFIFFVGASLAGTLTSAMLRLTQAEWRRPITRLAEAITVFSLILCGLQILLDMGRPERALLIFFYGRLQSPLLWDAIVITLYLLGSAMYLYLPLIPDIALVRDHLPDEAPAWRKKFYTWLALGWRGTARQWQRLEKVIGAMAIVIIPIAISVHTVTAWILATTIQPGWHSTILGPYFVVAALCSGVGLLFIAMSVMRRVLHLEAYLTERQYRNLGAIFIVMTMVWFYFTYTENLTLVAGQQEAEFPVLASKLWGQAALTFWGMVVLVIVAFWVLVMPRLIPTAWGQRIVTMPLFRPRFAFSTALIASVMLAFLFVPGVQPVTVGLTDTFAPRLAMFILAIVLLLISGIAILPWLKAHWIASSLIAAGAVVVSMWLERWNLVIPTLTRPRLIPYTIYIPTLTEWSLTIASFALFALLLLVFFKFFPAISIWEVAEGRVIDAVREKIEMPLPEPSEARQRLQRWGLKL